MTDPHRNELGAGMLMDLTPGGLPYPTSQEPVADTAGFIQQLAQAIDHRLDRRAIMFWRTVLTTNAGGDMTVTFGGFTNVQGFVIQPYSNAQDGAANIWVLVPRITGLIGNVGTVHVDYVPMKTTGYLYQPFANGGHDYNVFGWGVPVP